LQILEPPQTESYTNEKGHYIKTFLISTKANEAGWKVNRATIQDKINSFIGKPFVIIPEHLSSQRQKGHIFANSKEGLLEEYKKHTHGIIESISEPFSYNDGTDDVFYTANIKLNDSKAASALLDSGAKTWVPFAVSPHIWHSAGPENDITDWEGISLSLVPKGAYGQEAVINKYCKGDKPSCDRSLAAAICDKEDSSLAASITSLVSQSETKDIMSAQVQQIPQVTAGEQTKQAVQEEQKKDVVTLTPEQYEALLKDKKDKKNLEEQIKSVLSENKTNKLNNIFKSVKDEQTKKTLFDKYFADEYNVNHLNDFYSDVVSNVFPSLVEEAKAEAAKELEKKTIEENKGKSKAASLPKEPKVDESKAASIVPKSVNEIIRFDRLMRNI